MIVSPPSDEERTPEPSLIRGWQCPACLAIFEKPGHCPKHESYVHVYLRPMVPELPPE